MLREERPNTTFLSLTLSHFVKQSKKPIEAIAADSNVPIAEMHQYLNGEKDPDEPHLRAICESLAIDIEEFTLSSLCRNFRNSTFLVK